MFNADVFTSACAFLRQTGWQEKCVSLTQAFLELNLKRSHDVSSPLLWLRKFWESSSRRFGEVEASIEILGRGPQRAVNGIDCKIRLLAMYYLSCYSCNLLFIAI